MKTIFLLLMGSVAFTSLSQPSFQSSVTTTGDAAAATINKPGGTSNKDLLIVALMYEKGNVENITAPVGWQLKLRTDNSNSIGMATYFKIAGASEPSSYTFNLGSGSRWCMSISRISNASATAPFEDAKGSIGSSTAVGAPSVTTLGANRLILSYYTNKKPVTFTPAPGTVERYDAPNTASGHSANMMSTFLMANAGATGTKTATASDNDDWAAQQLAIKSDDLIVPQLHTGFQAKVCGANKVCFSWQQLTTANIRQLIIQYSVNGQQWQNLKYVPLNANRTNLYTATHNYETAGSFFFRLKAVYINTHYFSNIVKLHTATAVNKQLYVYPNPASNRLIVDGAVNNQYQLYTFNGQELFIPIASITSRNLQTALDVSSLKEGFYIIRSGQQTATFFKR